MPRIFARLVDGKTASEGLLIIQMTVRPRLTFSVAPITATVFKTRERVDNILRLRSIGTAVFSSSLHLYTQNKP
jgi:hypothetical protein